MINVQAPITSATRMILGYHKPYTQTRKTLITREPYEQDNLSQVAHNAQIDQFWENNLKLLQMTKEDSKKWE